MNLAIIRDNVIVEDFKFSEEDSLITIEAEYHSEDEAKEEKFERDLSVAIEESKQDIKKDYELIATQYMYKPYHFNVQKLWYFLEKGSYKRTEPLTQLGIVVQGKSYYGINPDRTTGDVLQNRKKVRRKRRVLRERSSEEDM